ncbi:hypothetical protein KM043_011513 [Ampulex compressa]|nr:hypothetical protein KM043_011513 [Ampulex compressa]
MSEAVFLPPSVLVDVGEKEELRDFVKVRGTWVTRAGGNGIGVLGRNTFDPSYSYGPRVRDEVHCDGDVVIDTLVAILTSKIGRTETHRYLGYNYELLSTTTWQFPN